MPTEYQDRISRLKDVEREYSTMRFATNCLLKLAGSDSRVLASVKTLDVKDASERLEGTYFIRLFAEFESSLRVFWALSTTKKTKPKTEDLINGIAARVHISDELKTEVHTIRIYRNSLIHGEDQPHPAITISVGRGHLSHFFSRLESHWKRFPRTH